jgi:hypothetical protein
LKFYWDTSAAINALVSKPVWDRLDQGEHFTRTHLFSEFFSTMTKRGIEVTDAQGNPARFVMSPADAAIWLRKFHGKVKLVDLDSSEVLAGLDQAQARNVSGPKVYDYEHALAADKAGVDALLTRNTKDFQPLGGKARVEWP